jgi:hypothetical protein
LAQKKKIKKKTQLYAKILNFPSKKKMRGRTPSYEGSLFNGLCFFNPNVASTIKTEVLNDAKVKFLKQFVTWVRNWKELCNVGTCVGLTKDTFSATERSKCHRFHCVLFGAASYTIHIIR